MDHADMVCPVAPSTFNDLLRLEHDAIREAPEYLHELHDLGPVVWSDELQAFNVVGHAAAIEALRDNERFSSQLNDPKGPHAFRKLEAAMQRLAQDSDEFKHLYSRIQPDWHKPACLLNADPPLHTQQRAVVNRLFVPKAVEKIEVRVREFAHELIDRFVDRGHADLTQEFGAVLPLIVISEQLGVGVDRLDDFKKWSDDLVAPLGNDKLTDDDIIEMMRSQAEFTEYFVALLNERRINPREGDFISKILDPVGMPHDDSVAVQLSYIAQMIAAGNETSNKMISGGAARLARDHDMADMLRQDSTKIPAFVEEVVRLDSPVQALYRTARTATELGGVHIPAGSLLAVWYAGANRDDQVFEDPDELRLGRENGRSHIAFGKGVHACVGAPLARLEGNVAFSALLERLPNWTIAEDLGGEQYWPSYQIRGHVNLWVRFSPR